MVLSLLLDFSNISLNKFEYIVISWLPLLKITCEFGYYIIINKSHKHLRISHKFYRPFPFNSIQKFNKLGQKIKPFISNIYALWKFRRANSKVIFWKSTFKKLRVPLINKRLLLVWQIFRIRLSSLVNVPIL